jgi:hypothetical protein
VSELRALLSQALLDVGMLIDDARFDKTRLEAAAASTQQLSSVVQTISGRQPAVIANSFRFSQAAMARVFSHGWQQASGFAALAGARAHKALAVARLGGLLSLGIVLFDHVIDNLTERRSLLLEELNPSLLFSPSIGARTRHFDLVVDFLAALAVEIVAGARHLDGRPDDSDRFVQLLNAMHRGELMSVAIRRIDAPPSKEVWESMRCKSALPATAVGVLALLGNPAASNAQRDVVAAAATLVGDAFWIVDDLVDIQSDWEAGCWSRPLWILHEQTGENPDSGQVALRRVLDTGIAASEAHLLGAVLTQLASLAGASERRLLRPVQAAVRSWIEEIPATS